MPAIKVGSNKDFQNVNRPINVPNPVDLGDGVNKGYVDTKFEDLSDSLIGLGVPQDLDCSANPDYPVSPPGRIWIVPTGGAGKIGGANGVAVGVGDKIHSKGFPDPANPGDLIDVPTGDQATVGQYFFFSEGNREKATTDKQGLIEVATQQEVNDGINTENAVTPATLSQKLEDLDANSEYETTIGNASDTSFTINHGLNDLNVLIRVRETASYDPIETYTKPTNANNVQVAFTNAPAAGFYTVIINKK